MGKASRKKRERHGTDLTLPPSLQGAIKIRPHHEDTKISSSLGDLIDLYIIHHMTLYQFRKLVTVGAIAWNLSTLDEPRRTEQLGQFIQAAGDDNASDFEAVIRILIARKLTHFPDDSRFIVAWDVQQNKGRFHITTAAIVQSDNLKNLGNLDLQETVSV